MASNLAPVIGDIGKALARNGVDAARKHPNVVGGIALGAGVLAAMAAYEAYSLQVSFGQALTDIFARLTGRKPLPPPGVRQ
jgi:hypothetical protein